MRCGRLQRSRRAGIQIGIHTNHAALVPDSGCISRGIWPERRVGRRCRAAPNAPAGAGAAWHSGASRPVDRDSCQFGDAHHLVLAGDPVGHRPAFCAHRVALRRPGRMGSRMEPAYLSLLLGVFLMGNLPLLFRKPAPQVTVKTPHAIELHVLGATAGFISGFTGAVGLVFNGFYYRLGLRKEEIVATRAANEIMLHVLKIALYAEFGLLNTRASIAGIAVAAAAVLSSIIMKYLLPHLHDRLFHHIGHAAMVVAGVMMVISASSQLARQANVTVHFAHVAHEAAASVSWRQHTFAVEWENGDERELSPRVLSRLASSPMITTH